MPLEINSLTIIQSEFQHNLKLGADSRKGSKDEWNQHIIYKVVVASLSSCCRYMYHHLPPVHLPGQTTGPSGSVLFVRAGSDSLRIQAGSFSI